MNPLTFLIVQRHPPTSRSGSTMLLYEKNEFNRVAFTLTPPSGLLFGAACLSMLKAL